MFARCISAGNLPDVCYFGAGYERDPAAAFLLADSKAIRARAEEVYRQTRKFAYQRTGYQHITDIKNAEAVFAEARRLLKQYNRKQRKIKRQHHALLE
jgi:hypothetical protein